MKLASEVNTFNAELKEAIQIKDAALDKLARLGNEPHIGNSIGNEIAASALTPAQKRLATMAAKKAAKNGDTKESTDA